ncbi:MAG: biotin--[acetyl-CoA-carboxylase] synthetase [Ilumatobacteraceae bacterium]|nr:biotin--[acetyl-CoA-carboxylase] synthetase [Ilumatobacteraceae bacterium]
MIVQYHSKPPGRTLAVVADRWQVRWVDETGSTNADLVGIGTAGAPDRSVLAARHQTAGRGRLDRRWETPAGANLLVSLLLRDVPPHPHEITQRVALAAVDACRMAAGVTPSLKWPNDLLVDGRKLAGILAQAGSSAAGPFVVVGVGLNVGWAPDGAARLGDGVSPAEVLDALLVAYDALPADIAARYQAELATIGQQVRVELPGERFLDGRAIGVEADGRLLVLDDCAITHRIDTGDVVHLRRV